MTKGQLEHSSEFPAWLECEGENDICEENIICEVICRSGSRYLLCQSVDFVYAIDPDTLEVLDVFKKGWNWDNPEYEDGGDEEDRLDCQAVRLWQWQMIEEREKKLKDLG